MSKSITVFVFLIIFSVAVTAVAADCTPGVDNTRLNAAFLEHLRGQVAKGDAIAVLPFQDIHGYQPEPLLPFGISFLIYDMYAASNPKIIHPYYVFSVTESLGLNGEALNDPAQIRSLSAKLGARFVVHGSVQRFSPTEVRVIIRLYDAKADAFISPPTEFATDLNDAFFSLMRGRIEAAFKSAKATLKGARYDDPSMQAFRYYVRALQMSSRYDAASLDVASAWFENALKEGYQKYDDAALGLARTRYMSGLLQKLNKSDFTQNHLAARKALSLVRNPSGPKYAIVRRYGDAQNAFISAATAIKAGNYGTAAKDALEAVTLLPEDGMAETLYGMALAHSRSPAKITLRNPICL